MWWYVRLRVYSNMLFFHVWQPFVAEAAAQELLKVLHPVCFVVSSRPWRFSSVARYCFGSARDMVLLLQNATAPLDAPTCCAALTRKQSALGVHELVGCTVSSLHAELLTSRNTCFYPLPCFSKVAFRPWGTKQAPCNATCRISTHPSPLTGPRGMKLYFVSQLMLHRTTHTR